MPVISVVAGMHGNEAAISVRYHRRVGIYGNGTVISAWYLCADHL